MHKYSTLKVHNSW